MKITEFLYLIDNNTKLDNGEFLKLSHIDHHDPKTIECIKQYRALNKKPKKQSKNDSKVKTEQFDLFSY